MSGGASLQSVDQFVSQLKRRQVFGSNQTALETAQLLRTVISNSRWGTAAVLIATIRELAVRLVRAQPVEFAVGNVVRRVLHLIREEYRHSMAEAASPYTEDNNGNNLRGAVVGGALEPNGSISNNSSVGSLSGGSVSNTSTSRMAGDSSMFNMLAEGMAPAADYSRQCFPLKQLVIQGVNEIIEELDGVYSTLSHQAVEHVQSQDVVMTIGRSGAVERFLLAAARKRRFQVIVAEGGPGLAGHRMARTLAEAGVETLLISDAAIYAMMGRANRVFIGCHAVTANGGLIGPAGTQLLADAAKQHAIPVCVVAGLYKLTPIYPENSDSFNLLGTPAAILPYSDGDLMAQVDGVSPQFDYVPPSCVSLFVTNTGGHPPSYVYRLMREMYDPEDYVLC